MSTAPGAQSPRSDAASEHPPGPRSPRATAGMICLALAAGLLLRLWFVSHLARVTGDSLVYGDLARNLLAHHLYGFSQAVNGTAAAPRPTLIRLPGYPLFLALCFRLFGVEHYTAVMRIQIAFDLGTCLLLAGIAARLFGPSAKIAAVFLAALCPFTANYTAAPLTETLTLFFIALAFYALTRWRHSGAGINRWFIVLGLALSYAILLRPEQVLLAAAVVPAILWISLRRAHTVTWRGFSPALCATLLAIAPLAPWTVRNWHTFHVLQPLAPRFANDPGEANPDGFQRWYRTWAIDFASTEDVYWNYDGSPINIGELPNRAFSTPAQRTATQSLLNDYNENTAATPDLDHRFDALARIRIRAYPLRYYLELPAARVLNMAFRPRTEMLPVPLEWWSFSPKPRASAFATLYAALNFAFFAAATVFLCRARQWRADPLIWSMLATIVLRAALLLTLDNSEPRYTLEFYPVLIVLAAGLWRTRDPTSRTASL